MTTSLLGFFRHFLLAMLLSIRIGALFGVQLPVRTVSDRADYSRETRRRGVDDFQVPGGKSGMLLTSYFLIKGLEDIDIILDIMERFQNMCLVPVHCVSITSC